MTLENQYQVIKGKNCSQKFKIMSFFKDKSILVTGSCGTVDTS